MYGISSFPITYIAIILRRTAYKTCDKNKDSNKALPRFISHIQLVLSI